MNLSEELEKELTEEIVKIEEDRKMSIITSAERVGIKKGKIEGMIKGKMEGKIEGKIEGKMEGKMEGKIEGLHESIYDIFEIKFGKNIYEFFAQVQQIQDIEILQNIRLGLKKAQTFEESKKLILLQLSNWKKN